MRPSRKPQSSATKEVVKPIWRAKPLIHLPEQSYKTPPAPAEPGFPKAEPLELSLTKLVGGGDHPIRRGSFLKEVEGQGR